MVPYILFSNLFFLTDLTLLPCHQAVCKATEAGKQVVGGREARQALE